MAMVTGVCMARGEGGVYKAMGLGSTTPTYLAWQHTLRQQEALQEEM
jgi:hypothetical protein